MMLMIFLAIEPPPVDHPVYVIPGCSVVFCRFNWDSVISSAIAIVVTIAVMWLISRRLSTGVPGQLQLWVETIYGYATGQAIHIDREAARFIVPLTMTIFVYVLVANWIDFLPLPVPIHPANTDLNQTAALGVLVFVIVQWYSIRVQGLKGYFRRFTKPFDMSLPVRIAFIPLNIVEELAKPLTLSLRLFGNLFGGAVMIWVITVLLPQIPFVKPVWSVLAVILLAGWKVFDVGLIGLIQAFIFMLLTLVYFEQAREGIEEHHPQPRSAGVAAAHQGGTV
jgi:F-type H+-transporting ATPase subunit a